MLCTFLFCACFLVNTISAQTSIKKENDAWVLLVDENPFEVKGVTFGYENDVANYDKHFKDLNLDTHDTNKLINNFILPTKNKKRNVSESKKKYIASNQQWKCKKCNSILDATYEIDHIIPLYKGGDNELANLEALCRNCHGNKTLLDKII